MDTAASVAEWIRKSCWSTCICFLHRGRKKRDCEGRDVTAPLPSTAPSVGHRLQARAYEATCRKIRIIETKRRKGEEKKEIHFQGQKWYFFSLAFSRARSDTGHLSETDVNPLAARHGSCCHEEIRYPRPRSADQDRTSCSSGRQRSRIFFCSSLTPGAWFFKSSVFSWLWITWRGFFVLAIQTEDGTNRSRFGEGEKCQRRWQRGDSVSAPLSFFFSSSLNVPHWTWDAALRVAPLS